MNAVVKTMTPAEIREMLIASGASIEAIKAAVTGMVAKVKGVRPKPINSQAAADKAELGDHRVANAVGLYLNKGETGGYWFYRYRLFGRRREMGLGAFGDVSLIEARKRRDAAAALKSAKRDPIAERKTLNRAAAAEARVAERQTFKEVAEAFLKANEKMWQGGGAKRVWHNPIAKYCYPIIGGKLVDDIEVADVVAIMNAAIGNGRVETGLRLRSRVESIIASAVVSGQRTPAKGNPADLGLVTKLAPALKRQSQKKGGDKHHARLDLAAAPAAFRRILERARGDSKFAAWAMMILCGLRPNEALYGKFDEVDFEAKTWTIPGRNDDPANGRMKAGASHVVPLSDLALELLKAQAERRRSSFIFPGRSGGKPSYSNFQTAPRLAGIDAATAHGWRSVLRDAGEDVLGVHDKTLEACLAHSLGKVAKAYRRETGVEARRAALQVYSDWLMGRIPATNVVALKRASTTGGR
jgi:integrase